MAGSMHRRHSFPRYFTVNISFVRQYRTVFTRIIKKDDYVAKMAGREIPGYYFGEFASPGPDEQGALLQGDRSIGILLPPNGYEEIL